MQHWKEIPRDWIWTGDTEAIRTVIRVQMARRDLKQENVAAIIGLKRQALARRLNGETPWRRSELCRLADAWTDTDMYELTGEDETDDNRTPVAEE